MLRIEHLSKGYRGGRRAVNDLSLRVEPGEICGFIGHNGAGEGRRPRNLIWISAPADGEEEASC